MHVSSKQTLCCGSDATLVNSPKSGAAQISVRDYDVEGHRSQREPELRILANGLDEFPESRYKDDAR
jgi:hypothetical protein